MSTYSDDGWRHLPRSSVSVEEDPKTFRVTWRGEEGKRFRALIHQKPNPIGFRAALPGGRRKR